MLVLPESLLPEFEEIKKAGYTGDTYNRPLCISLSDATYPPIKNNPCDIILTNHDSLTVGATIETAFRW